MTSTPPLPENWALRFFTIWAGQAASIFGSALVQFALVWYLTQESGSATVLAMATVAAMLPQIVVGPFAGTLVDRLNRRWVMVIADAAIAVATLGLVYLFAAGAIQIWHIYALLFVRGVGGAFHWPAMQASTSLMVPEKHLSRIAGMNQTLQGAVSIVAPPTGALLLELLSTQNVLLIDVGTAALAILPLLFIAIPQPTREDGVPLGETRYWQDLAEGFRYVASWPGLMGILAIAALLNFLLTPTGSLMPLLVTDHFGGDALQFGLMDSFWGGGIILGGLALSVWGGFKRKIMTALVGVIGIGIGVLMVGAAPAWAIWLAFAGMFLSGAMMAFANGPLMAIIQSAVRPEMQGRVMSLMGSLATAVSPLGLLIAGPFSDWAGVRTWYWVSGGITLLVGVGAYFIPVVMNVEENKR